MAVAPDRQHYALQTIFSFFLGLMVVAYLFLVELMKRRFFEHVPAPAHPRRGTALRRERRVRRRAARWVRHGSPPARVDTATR